MDIKHYSELMASSLFHAAVCGKLDLKKCTIEVCGNESTNDFMYRAIGKKPIVSVSDDCPSGTYLVVKRSDMGGDRLMLDERCAIKHSHVVRYIDCNREYEAHFFLISVNDVSLHAVCDAWNGIRV